MYLSHRRLVAGMHIHEGGAKDERLGDAPRGYSAELVFNF